ncbi:hypothetical protein [Mycolicibacterium llatzerense]|uniref:hypothetical protein n=1 Tax=Mycolicibacterium llatzerense TaxID=280871 RepID=UPI0008DD5AE9|nr:hypothetical protein [Mycolicibacterium llatzerense]
MADQWVMNPNRFEIGEDAPGRNGHYRAVPQKNPTPTPTSLCEARVRLPRKLKRLAEPDGTVTFGGQDWRFVVGAARTFARAYSSVDKAKIPPPFGYRRDGQWWWWDNTTTQESILETPEAADHVREYLGKLFPRCTVELVDRRTPTTATR